MSLFSTIIFDLSEVSLRGCKGVQYVLAHRLGLPAEEVADALFGEALHSYCRGETTEDLYLERVVRANGWHITLPLLRAAIRQNFGTIEGTQEIITKLHRHGYRLALLSDHGREWVDYIEHKFAHHKLYDRVFYSYEIGVCKPDARAYRYVLEKLEVAPEHCLFIDDKLQNVRAAEELGIRSLQFMSASALKDSLRELGVL